MSPMMIFNIICLLVFVAFLIKSIVKPTMDDTLPNLSEAEVMRFMRKTINLDDMWELQGVPTIEGENVFINKNENLLRRATFDRATKKWIWTEEVLTKPTATDKKEADKEETTTPVISLEEWFADHKKFFHEMVRTALVNNQPGVKILPSKLPEDKNLWEEVAQMLHEAGMAERWKVVENGINILFE